MIKVLDNWCVTFSSADPYLAPELNRPSLKGQLREDYREISLYGRPFCKGDYIRTSTVVRTQGRKVFTRSGSCYKLGKIDPKYRKFLKEKGIAYDPHNPIKVVS